MSYMDVDSSATTETAGNTHHVSFAATPGGHDSRIMHDVTPAAAATTTSTPTGRSQPPDGRGARGSIDERPSLNRARSNWVMSNPTDDIHAHYLLGDQLGQPGQFGYARLCQHKQTGEQRAVKILSKGKFSRASDRKVHFDELRTEIEVMRRMRCDHIIRMYDVYETLSELYIVMELCRGGELFDRIKAQPDGSYSENDAVDIVRQMALGIQYLHQHKIAHCDLKPDNFLFLDETKQSSLKIIDFGMSKWVKRRRYFHSLRGTPYYIAPEVITGRYSYHCDMWSMGVVMFVMLFGYPPFHGDTDQAIFAAVSRGFQPVTKKGFGAHFPADIPCSDIAKDLIAKLLTLDIAKRLTADEALEHAWFSRSSTLPVAPMVTSVVSNLKAFTSTCKFKTGILNLMTTSLGEEEVAQLKATFQDIDENGDGQITLAELSKAVQRSGDSTRLDDIARLFRIADFDGSGTLSYNELLMTVVQRKLGAKEERLWNAFCKIDLNGDGKLTAEEIQQVLGKDSEEARRMIQEIDVDGDGEIDFDEFITMWMDKDNKSGSGQSSPQSQSRSNSLVTDSLPISGDALQLQGPPDEILSPSKQMQKQIQQQQQQQAHAQALAQARAVASGLPASSAQGNHHQQQQQHSAHQSGSSTPIQQPVFHAAPSTPTTTSTSTSTSTSSQSTQPKHLSESTSFANAAAVFGLTTKQASYKAPSGTR